jgi:hypothetical protein
VEQGRNKHSYAGTWVLFVCSKPFFSSPVRFVRTNRMSGSGNEGATHPYLAAARSHLV